MGLLDIWIVTGHVELVEMTKGEQDKRPSKGYLKVFRSDEKDETPLCRGNLWSSYQATGTMLGLQRQN